MRAAAADSPGLQGGPVPLGAPERLAGRKLQDAGAVPSAEEDGGGPGSGPVPVGAKWEESCAAARPLRRFTWSQNPAAFSVSTPEHAEVRLVLK